MSELDISVAGKQRFECIRCGRCCRRWHVALSDAEVKHLRGLGWHKASRDAPRGPVTIIKDHPYVAHRANGDCIFLDAGTVECELHRHDGVAAKPLGCRVYPLNIAPTYWGEVSVTARMDCPAVQRNVGPPLASCRNDVREYVRLMRIEGGFDQEELDGLSPEAIRIIVRALLSEAEAATTVSAARTAMSLFLMVERIRQLGTAFINDTATLEEVLGPLLSRIREAVDRPVTRCAGPFSRAAFRQWLAAYLRRDEEMIMRGFGARIARTWTLCQLLAGRGSLRALGSEHPDVALQETGMFMGLQEDERKASPPGEDVDFSVWECYWRFLISRLQALQFFGVSYYNNPFFTGLRALVLTFPLVLAAARCHAAERGSRELTAADIQYAVGAIDHSFGRSRFLQMLVWRQVELYFSGSRYALLLKTLGWG